MIFYLDESGCEGFKFNLPQSNGGSSKYLTLFIAEVPKNEAVYLAHPVNFMHQSYKWTKKEKKGSQLSPGQSKEFIELVLDLLNKRPSIKLHCITVYKPRVQKHIQNDSNKLYNWMVRLLCLDHMAKHPEITLAHDQRTLQVASGNSLKDYLQMELWFTKNVQTVINTKSLESHANRNILFVDYLAHICWSYYEYGEQDFAPLAPKINCKTLFF